MARLEIEGLRLARDGRTLLEGLTLELETGCTAIVGGSREAMVVLALELAGLPSGAMAGGSIRLDDAPYPAGEAELAKLRPRIGLIGAGAGLDGLAALLQREPRLIVCDEPLAGLTGDAHRELAEAILAAGRERAIGLLLLTADMQLALAMSEQIIVLDGPRVVESGSAVAIADRPRNERTRRLLGTHRPRTRTMMRPPIGEPLLELEAVTQRFRDPRWSLFDRRPPVVAVQPTSFAVRRGEAVGLLGAAGAGKSTLLRLAAGLGRASGGQLLFERNAYVGANLPGDLRATIGLVFPDPHQAFNPALPVGLSLTEPLRVEQQLLVDEQADRLVEVVRAVGLEPAVLERLPGTFGTMELQLLALARALASRPKLILLDEPTLLLDPAERAEFLVLFNRLRSDNGLTVLAASRDFEVLRVLSDRILVLESGHIVEGGKPSELADGAQHAATRRLVAPRYPAERAEEAPAPVMAEPTPTAPNEIAATPETAAAASEAPPEPAEMPAEVVVLPPVPIPEPAPAPTPVVEPEPLPTPEPEVPLLAPAGTLLPPAPRLIAEAVPQLPAPLPADPASPEAAQSEPAPSTGDGADEGAEGRQSEHAVDRPGN